MWHPHLKKRWINDKEFDVVDHKKRGYPAFIQIENKEDAFLKEDNNKKMQCTCRFIKEGSKNVKKRLEENEIQSLIAERNLPDPKHSFLQKPSNQAYDLLMKKSGNFRLKEIEPQENQLVVNNKSEIIENGDGNNLEGMLKKLNQFSALNSNSNQYNKEGDSQTYSTTSPSQIQRFLEKSMLKSNNNILNNFGYPMQNFNPQTPQINYQSIINYLELNSLIMKNLQNVLLNQQNMQNSNNYMNMIENKLPDVNSMLTGNNPVNNPFSFPENSNTLFNSLNTNQPGNSITDFIKLADIFKINQMEQNGAKNKYRFS